MANSTKKTKTKTKTAASAKSEMIRFCSFWALALAIILWALTLIPPVKNAVGSILSLCAELSMLLAVAFPAYDYTRGKGKGWKIAYWIILVLYAAVVVLKLF